MTTTDQPNLTQTKPEHWKRRRLRRPDGAGSDAWPFRVSLLRLDRQCMDRVACRSYAAALRKVADALKGLDVATGALPWTRAIVDQWRETELQWYRLAVIDAPRPACEGYTPHDAKVAFEKRKALARAGAL